MTRIAIVYPEFFVGGTTTSLLFLLNSLDYSRAQVDLLIYRSRGSLLKLVNPNVRLINVGKRANKLIMFFHALFTGRLFVLFFRTAFRKGFLRRFRRGIEQIGGYYRAQHSALVSTHYDVAIGFMEFWASAYVARLSATKKNVIIHPNYESADFNLFLDAPLFEQVDNISFVSEANCQSFNASSKNRYLDKVMKFPNLLNAETIKTMAKEEAEIKNFSQTKCLLATSARLSFYSKGFDRVLQVASLLLKKGFPFVWVIIGSGSDLRRMEKEVQRSGLKENIILVGEQENPYRFVSKCDYFVLLSRREGRPMSVDEALILGKKCIVTSYETANEQLGNSGAVVPNEPFSPEKVADLIVEDFQKGNVILPPKEDLSDYLGANTNIIRGYLYES